MHSTEQAADHVFVGIRSGIVLRAVREWNGEAVRAALQSAVQEDLTTSSLGAQWEPKQSGKVAFYQLDGLLPLAVATQGNLLIIANNASMLESVLQRASAPANPDIASSVVAFNHGLERGNFERLMTLVDRLPASRSQGADRAREPAFFSENVASFSRMLGAVKSEKMLQRDEGAIVRQTLTYEWAH
jgi:hypothetical protein